MDIHAEVIEEAEPLKESELYEVAEKLSNLIPTFKRKFVRPLEQHVKYTLTPMQTQVLFILGGQESFSMTELSREMQMCKQQMTPLVDKLIEHGFVNREQDCTDRRSLRISLTVEGTKIMQELHQSVLQILKGKLECLEHEDLISLNKALDDFYRTLKKIE